MKAIIIARVSDKKQDSNEAQKARILKYCEHTQLDIWKIYEIEESSTKGDRKRFQEAIKEIQNAKERIAIVADTVDRIQRSFRESVVLDEFRKSGKLDIHFYRENLVLTQNSNSADLLRWDMAVMFARSYVLQLSDNVKRKLDQMVKQGEWPGKPPIGYVSEYNDKGERLSIISDSHNRHFIKKIFELYGSGNYSLKSIRNALENEGLKSGSGKSLAVSMINHILNNPFYYGEMNIKGKLYPHKYEPLVSKQQFEKCQTIKKGWGKKHVEYAVKQYVLGSGFIKCVNCGCTYSPETHKGFVYYSCTNAKGNCNRVYAPENELLKPIRKVLGKLSMIPQGKADAFVEDLKKTKQSKTKYHQQVIKTLNSEYNLLQVRIDKLLDLLLDEKLEKDQYDQRLKDYRAKQYAIKIKLEDYSRADETYYIIAANVFDLAMRASSLFESSEVQEKRAILNCLLQNCVVDRKNLVFTLKSPFKEILDMVNHPMRLPLLDKFRTVNWNQVETDVEQIKLMMAKVHLENAA